MITTAIARAYDTMKARNWDTIYWAIDLHGVCLESNYAKGVHTFISEEAINTLRLIGSLKESKIIIWSSVHEKDKQAIIDLFIENGIPVHGFNSNPSEADTKTGCFKEKFYFSVLLDDKAGFDPAVHWKEIGDYLYSLK
jgi:hypothetical protein